jgi:hypothetical protein
MASTCGSSPRPTKLRRQYDKQNTLIVREEEHYMVETPASIAEDSVNAINSSLVWMMRMRKTGSTDSTTVRLRTQTA